MSQKDMFDPDLKIHLDELSEILESQLSKKDVHVQRLVTAYADHQLEIEEAYETWQSLEEMAVPEVRPEMDLAFYKMLNSQKTETPQISTDAPKVETKASTNSIIKMLSPRRLAIAATFLIGLVMGQWMDFGNIVSTQIDPAANSLEKDAVLFASYELTPSASDRIRGINEVRENESLDLKIIEALNEVILNDPNVNVRLTAIETMSVFADIPEARQFLIEAIPYQQSSIVQLELADIMISLEEKESADEWNELLSSDDMENDVKIHLKESLKTIL